MENNKLNLMLFISENKSNADYIHLTSSPGLVIYNKSMNIVDYLSLGSTISCSDFNFEPVNNSSNVTGKFKKRKKCIREGLH